MHWIYFALLAAISESLKNLCAKQGLHVVSPQLAALAASLVPIPIFLSMLLAQGSMPPIGPQFVLALLLSGTLNVLALYQFMRALQDSDMSLSIPFISFTPIFLLFTSPLLVNEVSTSLDIAGILFIVSGAYLLQIHSIYQGWFTPIRAMFSQPGPRRMLGVALIYSFSSNFDKIGVQNSSPVLWSLAITSFMTIGFFIIIGLSPRPIIPSPITNSLGILSGIGLFHAISLFFHNSALSIGDVSLVIAVKRASIFFAVLWGILFLREHCGKERLAGASLMVIGILLLGLRGS